MNQKGRNKHQNLKLVLALIAILAGVAYSAYSLLTYARGIPPDRDQFVGGPGGPGGPPSPENRRQAFQEMADEAKLTLEQKAKLLALQAQGPPKNPEEGKARFEEMKSVLTPEQQATFRTGMESRMQRGIQRRLERAKRVLPQDQYKIYEERVQKRAQEMKDRMAKGLPPPGGHPPGGPPPGGPPPGGPPPDGPPGF